MDELSTPEVALLVGMIGTGGRSGRWWPQKARTILALATYVDGEWFNGPDVERLTGIPQAHARRILLELAAQKVIVRDGGDGPTQRLFWCQVNPDWRSWDVEWSFDRRDIELRLEYARGTWARQPLERLFARPAGARYGRKIAQLSARGFERENAAFRAGIARGARAITDPGSRAARARSRATRAQEVSLLGRAGVADDTRTAALVDPQQAEGESHPRWTAVRHAAARAAGVPRLYGKAAAQLAVLLAGYGDDQVLEAIAEAPAGLGGHMSFLGWLEERLELGPAGLASVTPIVEAPRGPAAPSAEVLAAIEAADREREAQLAESGEVLGPLGRRWHDGAAAEEA